MNEKFYIDLITLIILLVIYIILVISEMRIFKKAGEKSYKALIPFYNVYLSHKIVGMHHIWFVIEMILWVGEVVTAIVKLNHTVELSFSINSDIVYVRPNSLALLRYNALGNTI